MGSDLLIAGWTHDNQIAPDVDRMKKLVRSILLAKIPHDGDGVIDYADPAVTSVLNEIDPVESVFYNSDTTIDDAISHYQFGAQTYHWVVSDPNRNTLGFFINPHYTFWVTGGTSGGDDPFDGWSNLIDFTNLAACYEKLRLASGFVGDGIVIKEDT